MESKPDASNVSLSTTQATPSSPSPVPAQPQVNPHNRTLSSSSSTGSVLIRAPLTLDDDDDDSYFESNGPKLVNSDSTGSGSSNSSDSVSESDEFVSGEEFETASERPFEVSMPFVADPDDQTSDITNEDEVVRSDVDEHGPLVELAGERVRPVAQLSMDDDEFDELLGDEGMGSEVEDNSFSVKVPSIRVLEGIDSAPRLKVPVVDDEGSEDESLVGGDASVDNQSDVVKNSVNDSVSVELVGEAYVESLVGVDASVDNQFDVVKNSLNDSVSVELVGDNGLVVTQEAHVESLVGEDASVDNQSDVVKNSVNDLVSVELVGDKGLVVTQEAHVESSVGSNEDVSLEAEEPTGCQDDESSSFDVSGSATLDRGGDSEKSEIKTEPGIDLRAELHDILFASRVELIDNVVEGNGIQIVDSSGISHPNPNGDLRETTEGDALLLDSNSVKIVAPSSILDGKVKQETEEEARKDSDILQGAKGLLSDEDVEGLIFGSSVTTEPIMNELEQRLPSSSLSEAEGSQGHSWRIDGHIDMESDEEVDADTDGEGKELLDSAALVEGQEVFNSAALVALLKAAAGAESDSAEENLSEEEKKKMDKIQGIRVKFLRLVRRLGHSPYDSIVLQVLQRLALALGTHSSQEYSLEYAKMVAMQLETHGKDDLDFSLNILVLGKTGVGKSATVNSIFGEQKTKIDAFEPATTCVKEIVGRIDGVNVRILDTPGLKSHPMQQAVNRKILASIKKFTKKFPPDVVLYVDRLDTQTRDHNDLPLLKSLTDSLSSSIWQNAIVTLTHAASAPPDGPSGSPISYEVFAAQSSRVVQHSISKAVGDLRLMDPSMMNPVSLVENHPLCQKNGNGESVLPNGQCWRTQLLLLCYSLKILSESNSISTPQDPFDNRRLFRLPLRSSLLFLLSSLLQSQVHPKLSADQGGYDVDSDIELGDSSNSDQEEENDDYDQLPPFKPLRKSQVARLSKEQRKAYFEEYDYRVKLLQKKQWREEVTRLRELKKKVKNGGNDFNYMGENGDLEDGNPATVPVPSPDMVLPTSFDSDNPAYRYRFLESVSQLFARPIVDPQVWDHDIGYGGLSLERSIAIAGRFPGSIAMQITKDKKDFNIYLDSSLSAKHGENGSSMAGFNIQTFGKQRAYIVKGETKFKNFKINKTAAGVSITLLGKTMATGVKIEDQIALGKRLVLIGSTGAMHSLGETAYGANLEVRLKDKDFPIGQDRSSLGLSLLKGRGGMSVMANVQSQFSFGRDSKMAIQAGLSNKGSGHINLKTSSSEQLQTALFGIVPLSIFIFRRIYPAAGA